MRIVQHMGLPGLKLLVKAVKDTTCLYTLLWLSEDLQRYVTRHAKARLVNTLLQFISTPFLGRESGYF